MHEGLDGQIPSVDAAIVAEHVARCAPCRARVSEAHGLISAAHRIVAALDEPRAVAAPKPAVLSRAPRLRSEPTNALLAVASLERSSGKAAPVADEAPIAALPELPVVVATDPRVVKPPTPRPLLVRPVVFAAAPARPVAMPVQLPKPFSKPIPWKRLGQIAAVLFCGAATTFAWRNRPMGDSVSARPRMEALPTVVGVVPVAAKEVVPPFEVFDSLVLTRRTCTIQCGEYELHVSSVGMVRYVEHVSFGQPRVVQDGLSALQQKSIGDAVSKALFPAAVISPTGHMLCSASDKDQRNNVRIVVSKGNASQSRSANNCNASSRELLSLGDKLDSLAGTARLQDLVPDR